jgi:hypothetical protein
LARKEARLKENVDGLRLEIDESLQFMRKLQIDGLDYFLKAWGVASLRFLTPI